MNNAGKEEKAACTTATASQTAATTQHAAATATKTQQLHMAFVFSVTGAADAEVQHQPIPSQSGYGLFGRNDCEDETAKVEAASQQKRCDDHAASLLPGAAEANAADSRPDQKGHEQQANRFNESKRESGQTKS